MRPAARHPDHDPRRERPARLRPGGSRRPPRCARPASGRRHHRRPDPDGLSVPRGRRGRRLAAGGGLGDGRGPRPARARRAEHGARPERRPRDVVHRSDQGSHPTSPAFGARVPRRRASGPRRARQADAHDDAMRESVLAALECALPQRRRLETKACARIAALAFVESWPNPSRRHSALGHRSPIERETITAEGPATATPSPVRRNGGTPAPAPLPPGAERGPQAPLLARHTLMLPVPRAADALGWAGGLCGTDPAGRRSSGHLRDLRDADAPPRPPRRHPQRHARRRRRDGGGIGTPSQEPRSLPQP